MNNADFQQLPNSEKEHFYKCRHCGEMVDKRQLDEVLFHADHKPRPDIQYGGSKRLHVYEVRPRKDKRGFDLISKALPFGGLWYTQVADAIDYAQHRSRAHDAVIRVYDVAGNVIEMHEHKGAFKEW